MPNSSWQRSSLFEPPFLNAFSVPLPSTSKAFKSIIPIFDFIFYQNWVTSIYNADKNLVKTKILTLQIKQLMIK